MSNQKHEGNEQLDRIVAKVNQHEVSMVKGVK